MMPELPIPRMPTSDGRSLRTKPGSYSQAVSGGDDDKSEKNEPPLRTGASAALGTPAEGTVEDGEGLSPADGTGAVPSCGKQYSDRNRPLGLRSSGSPA